MATAQSSFEGKLALITGGSSGVGLSLARLLAAEGAQVWILARRQAQLQAALSSLASVNGNRPGMLAADVTKLSEVQSAVERIKQEAGIPDILVNAAGAAHAGYAQETPLELYHEMMDLNYFGMVNMISKLLPDMLQRGSGYIVNFSSGSGFLALFGYAAYNPAKYAVRGLSDSLRLELKPLGIRMSVVFPPDTDTPGRENENKTKPFETWEAFSSKVLSADKVAASVFRGMKRGQYVILPGAEVRLWYHLTSLLGNAIYPLGDIVLAQARRKKAKLKGG